MGAPVKLFRCTGLLLFKLLNSFAGPSTAWRAMCPGMSWDGLELWVHGVFSDGDDHQSALRSHRSGVLRKPESSVCGERCFHQGSLANQNVVSLCCPHNSTSAFMSCVCHNCVFRNMRCTPTCMPTTLSKNSTCECFLSVSRLGCPASYTTPTCTHACAHFSRAQHMRD